MKTINRQFNLTLVVLILYFVGAVVGYVYLFRTFGNNEWVFASLFGVLLIFMFLLTYSQVRFEQLTSMKATIKIKQHAEPEKATRKALDSTRFINRYIKDGYTVHRATDEYSILYKFEKDMIKKILRNYVLEVAVYLNQGEEFYLADIDDELDQIKETILFNKRRVKAVMISQYLRVASLNDNIKKQLVDNIFLRTRNHIYSVVNVALDEHTSKAVFLHSLQYSPSLYYTHQINDILNRI